MSFFYSLTLLAGRSSVRAYRAGTCHTANVTEVMDWSVLPDAAVIILRAPDRVLVELHGPARS